MAEDSERGLLLGVAPAPRDPYAALSLYALDTDHGTARAALLYAKTSHLNADIDIEYTRGVMTFTASFLPRDALTVLAAVQEGFDAPLTTAPRFPDTSEDPLRATLFRAAPAPSVDSPGPLVVAVTMLDGAMSSAAELLKKWPGHGGKRTVAPTIPRISPGQITREDPDATYTRWRLACPAPARNDARYRAAALAALHMATLDGPLSTRLRRDHAAAYTVKTRVHPELGEGWLSFDVVVRTDRAPDPVSLVVEEIVRLRDAPPSQERIVALRSRMLSRIYRSLADNRGRCSDVASSTLYGLERDHHRRIESGVMSLNREDLLRAAEAIDVQRIVGLETPIKVRNP